MVEEAIRMDCWMGFARGSWIWGLWMVMVSSSLVCTAWCA